ncbi:MAG: hypothetical protein IKO12_04060 [Bacteroidaceae bacterium]|nr:hypothetical protein [Bacteroidaceae bacterium]
MQRYELYDIYAWSFHAVHLLFSDILSRRGQQNGIQTGITLEKGAIQGKREARGLEGVSDACASKNMREACIFLAHLCGMNEKLSIPLRRKNEPRHLKWQNE